jgi:hypothetical protein
MKTIKRSLAVAELLLISPAALFMTALFVRELEPHELEPARTAARIVIWYSGHAHIGLWVFLMALPFTVLVSGCVSLLKSWKEDSGLRSDARSALAAIRTQWAAFVVAIATLIAAIILAIVALHVLTN